MTPAAITLLANSITITPGTASVYHKNNRLYIHALNNEFAKGIADIKKQVILTTQTATNQKLKTLPCNT